MRALCIFVLIACVFHQPAWSKEIKPLPAEDTTLPKSVMKPLTLKSYLQKGPSIALSLEEVLRLANGENIQIKVEKEALKQKKADLYIHLSDLLPDVTLQHSQSRFLGNIQIFGSQTINIFRTTLQPQITANYHINPAGKDIFEIQASKHRKRAQASMLEEKRQDILSQSAMTYFDVQKAFWSRAIAQQGIKETQEEVTIQEARIKAGLGIKLDSLQAKTTLAQRDQDLIQSENDISKATHQLIQLLNMDLNVDIIPDTLSATANSLIPNDHNLSDLLALAKEHNPRIQRLFHLSKAAKADARVSIADLFPQVEITAYLNGTGNAFENLGLSRFVGAQATLDLFQNGGFSKPLTVVKSRAQKRAAELSLSDAKKLVEMAIYNSLVDVKTGESMILTSKNQLNYAKEAYHFAIGRLKEGLGTHVELENAQTALIQARTNVLNAFINYNKAQIRLLANLGLVSVETLTQGYTSHAASP